MDIKYTYCPQCKSEMDLSEEYPKCPNCNLTIYKNSIPCVGIFIVKDNKVLMHKRNIEPFLGSWDIIGGILDNGEHPQKGIKREVKEETGLEVEPTEILGIYMDEYNDGRKTLNIHYIGEVVGGKIKANEEVLALEWLDIKDIKIKNSFKNTLEALEDLKMWFENKSEIL